MEKFNKEYDRILGLLKLRNTYTTHTIYVNGFGGMEIADLFHTELLEKLFSLPSKDFIDPFLVSLITRKIHYLLGLPSLIVDWRINNVKEIFKDYMYNFGFREIEEMPPESNPRECILYQSYLLGNLLLYNISLVCKYFSIDYDELSTKAHVQNCIESELLEYFEIHGTVYTLYTLYKNEIQPTPERLLKGAINLTHKQKVLLLHEIGVFDLPKIAEITDVNKAKLFGSILQSSVDNTEDLIRYRGQKSSKGIKDAVFLHDQKTTEKVNEVLKEVGIVKL